MLRTLLQAETTSLINKKTTLQRFSEWYNITPCDTSETLPLASKEAHLPKRKFWNERMLHLARIEHCYQLEVGDFFLHFFWTVHSLSRPHGSSCHIEDFLPPPASEGTFQNVDGLTEPFGNWFCIQYAGLRLTGNAFCAHHAVSFWVGRIWAIVFVDRICKGRLCQTLGWSVLLLLCVTRYVSLWCEEADHDRSSTKGEVTSAALLLREGKNKQYEIQTRML